MNKILVSLLIVAIAVGMTLPAMATTAGNGQESNNDAGSGSTSGAATADNILTNTADGTSDATSGDNTATVTVKLNAVNTISSSVGQNLNYNGDQTNTGLQAIMAGSADAGSGATNGDTGVTANANGGKAEVEDSDDDNEVKDSSNAGVGVGPVSSGATSGAIANGGNANNNAQDQIQINAVVQLAFASVTNTQDLHQMVIVPVNQKNGAKSYVEIEDNGEGASQNAMPSSGNALSGAIAASKQKADADASSLDVDVPIEIEESFNDISFEDVRDIFVED